jgi:DNA-binding NarL/FixJ family response regulator
VTAHTRVLLAEGDAPIRAGLRLSLSKGGFEVVAEAPAHATAVDAAVALRPDVAILAVDLPDGGIETARRLGAMLPGMSIIVLSPDPKGEELLAAVLAGATGYLSKDMSLDRLAHTIRGVVEGEVALPRRYSRHLLEELRRRHIQRVRVDARASASLTDREWEVLQLLSEDASTAQMADVLCISQVTVRRHVSTLLGKLGVADRDAARQWVRRSAS